MNYKTLHKIHQQVLELYKKFGGSDKPNLSNLMALAKSDHPWAIKYPELHLKAKEAVETLQALFHISKDGEEVYPLFALCDSLSTETETILKNVPTEDWAIILSRSKDTDAQILSRKIRSLDENSSILNTKEESKSV